MSKIDKKKILDLVSLTLNYTITDGKIIDSKNNLVYDSRYDEYSITGVYNCGYDAVVIDMDALERLKYVVESIDWEEVEE